MTAAHAAQQGCDGVVHSGFGDRTQEQRAGGDAELRASQQQRQLGGAAQRGARGPAVEGVSPPAGVVARASAWCEIARGHRPEETAPDSRAARAALRSATELPLLLAGAQLGITACTLLLGAITKPAVHHAITPLLRGMGLPSWLADAGGSCWPC